MFHYETPKFLKQTNQFAQLNELMGKIYESDRINERISAITIEQGSGASPSYKDTLCHPRYMFATVAGCLLSMLQQFSGINAVMFYSSTIFSKANFSGRVGTAIVGVVNMASTFVALFLLGCFGRKTLLWTLSIVMGCFQIGLGIAYYYVETS